MTAPLGANSSTSGASPRSHRRHRQHGNPFSIREPIAQLDWPTVFGRTAPFAIDIGFGAGAFLLELARQHPEWNVLGLEIRAHFVEGALHHAKSLGLTNLHALLANANVHLTSLLPDRSVAFVSLNFPDPWFKRRHQKRRVLRSDWLACFLPKLMPGAEVHAMTDYQPLGLEMREVLESHSDLVNCDGQGCFASGSTTGIASERELTHQKRGEPIYRMRFRRR